MSLFETQKNDISVIILSMSQLILSFSFGTLHLLPPHVSTTVSVVVLYFANNSSQNFDTVLLDLILLQVFILYSKYWTCVTSLPLEHVHNLTDEKICIIERPHLL